MVMQDVVGDWLIENHRVFAVRRIHRLGDGGDEHRDRAKTRKASARVEAAEIGVFMNRLLWGERPARPAQRPGGRAVSLAEGAPAQINNEILDWALLQESACCRAQRTPRPDGLRSGVIFRIRAGVTHARTKIGGLAGTAGHVWRARVVRCHGARTRSEPLHRQCRGHRARAGPVREQNLQRLSWRGRGRRNGAAGHERHLDLRQRRRHAVRADQARQRRLSRLGPPTQRARIRRRGHAGRWDSSSATTRSVEADRVHPLHGQNQGSARRAKWVPTTAPGCTKLVQWNGPHDPRRAAERMGAGRKLRAADGDRRSSGAPAGGQLGLHEWLAGGGQRAWRGVTLAMLDAKPPQLVDAASRAYGAAAAHLAARCAAAHRDRRSRGRSCVHAARRGLLLIEVHAPAAETGSLRLSESLRGFAHEVKGPLAGVRGAAQLLQRHLQAPDQIELAELIMAEVDRLAALSDRLLRAAPAAARAHATSTRSLERVARADRRRASAPRRPARLRSEPAGDQRRCATACSRRCSISRATRSRPARQRWRCARAPSTRARIGERTLRLALRIDVVDDGRGVPARSRRDAVRAAGIGRADGHGLGPRDRARDRARARRRARPTRAGPGATVFTLLLPLSRGDARMMSCTNAPADGVMARRSARRLDRRRRSQRPLRARRGAARSAA